MTQEEIQKRNEAIALFVGLKRPDGKYDWPFGKHRGHLLVNKMKFNSSFEWILFAVDKMRSLKEGYDINISFEQVVCRIYASDSINWDPKYERGNYEPAIMNLFLAVSDFCINYNKSREEK